MKVQWKAVAKHGAITAGEVAVITGGIILTKKFLSAKTLFKNQIEKDPTFVDKWYMKHEGAVKVGIGVVAASLIKNPWLKMVAIGFAIEGAITEVRYLTTDKTSGASFFDAIGMGESSIDAEMLAAAKAVSGYEDDGVSGEGYGNRYESGVSGQETYGNRYTTAVSGNIDLNDMQSAYVSGFR